MHSSAGQGGLCLQAPSVPLLGPPVSAEPPATHISAHRPPCPTRASYCVFLMVPLTSWPGACSYPALSLAAVA